MTMMAVENTTHAPELHPDVHTALAPGGLRIEAAPKPVDLAAAENAARLFLRALGIDSESPDAPDLARTPRRFAKAYAELLAPSAWSTSAVSRLRDTIASRSMETLT